MYLHAQSVHSSRFARYKTFRRGGDDGGADMTKRFPYITAENSGKSAFRHRYLAIDGTRPVSHERNECK